MKFILRHKRNPLALFSHTGKDKWDQLEDKVTLNPGEARLFDVKVVEGKLVHQGELPVSDEWAVVPVKLLVDDAHLTLTVPPPEESQAPGAGKEEKAPLTPASFKQATPGDRPSPIRMDGGGRSA